MTKEKVVVIKRSVEFIFSLIASILGFGSGVFVLLFGGLATVFGASDMIMVLGFSGIIFSIVGFIACAIVKHQAKLAGTMMLFAGLGGAIVNGGFYFLPAILFWIAGIMALVRNDKGYVFNKSEKTKILIAVIAGILLIVLLMSWASNADKKINPSITDDIDRIFDDLDESLGIKSNPQGYLDIIYSETDIENIFDKAKECRFDFEKCKQDYILQVPITEKELDWFTNEYEFRDGFLKLTIWTPYLQTLEYFANKERNYVEYSVEEIEDYINKRLFRLELSDSISFYSEIDEIGSPENLIIIYDDERYLGKDTYFMSIYDVDKEFPGYIEYYNQNIEVVIVGKSGELKQNVNLLNYK